VKWIVVGTSTLLLGLAVLLAAMSVRAQDESRVSAGARLAAARDATADEVVRVVAEAREAVLRWSPGAEPPPPLARAWTDWGEDSFEDSVSGTAVSFTRHGGLDVFVQAPDGARRKARVAPETLRGRIEQRPEVGRPATETRPGNYTHVAVTDQRGSVLLLVPGPAREESRVSEAERMRRSTGLDRIARGVPCEYTDDGMPPRYKGADEANVLGAWGVVEPASKLHVLAEIGDLEALGPSAGVPLGFRGKELARVQLWHVALGLGLLGFVVVGIVALAGRDGKLTVLLRCFVFAKPYTAGIVLTIVAGMMFSGAQVSRAFLLKKLSDEVLIRPGPDARSELEFLAWATVGIGFAMALFGWIREYLQNFYATAMIADVRLAIGRRILTLPMSYLQRMRAGDLVARIERDTVSLRMVLAQVFEHGFLQPFVVVGSLVTAVMMNWRLALVLLGMPIILVPLFRIGRSIKKRSQKRQVLLAEISHVLFQILSGLKVIKAFGGEQREAKRLDEANRRYIRETRKIQRLHATSKALLDLLQMAGGAMLVYAGGIGVLEGGVSLGDLMAFMLVVQQVYAASKEITSTVNKLIEVTPGTERVWEILDAQDTLPDGTESLDKAPLREGIELRGVTFRYLDSDILRNVDLKFPAGKVVALVGPTGAGKTTICDLVARFYDPVEGQVLYDGRDVRTFTKGSLMRSVAIVTQDAFLFNAPVEENIRYGNPAATQEQVEQAARDAFVHEDILAMDGGYAKVAGERGTSLSGGQRQRVTIARAILKDAPVLILDEATSNLDSRSESMVQAAMRKLMAGRTVIVVAHRLSTIRNADRVVVLESGAVVEQGSPDDLLARPNGIFRRMWDSQMGGESGGAAAPA
jgi:subfamily B ATP-binding cassette protein MsbA